MDKRSDHVVELFAELLDCRQADRNLRLASIRKKDLELADELESLLQAHSAAPEFLGALDHETVADLLDDDDRRQMPKQAGPWRLIRELGRGGLGIVYLAERRGDFSQSAAVKLIKRGMDSEAILKRFEQERRLLATLDHPNIARLIDGGELDDGRPWFAMDFVDGRPITEWCDEQGLSILDRLHLFGQVCRAVQAAHARLIVHRDLKPSNILVTADGQAKLLDFGIAKLLQFDHPSEPALTRIGPTAMTPEYAAPEQIEGRPITVATDVYALGVVLYELICGRHPYRDGSATRESLQLAVRESRPEQPSRSIDPMDAESALSGIVRPATLRKQLRGDLDAIVLTALARDPPRRYGSVEALSDDIQRHLDGLPIRARARSRVYRLGRFLHRYRWSAAAVTGVLVALSVGLGAALWQADEARHQAMLADQSRDFVLSLLKETNPGQNEDGVDLRAVDLLLSAADRVEAAENLAPLIQGRLALVMAESLLEFGSMERALALAQLGVDKLSVSRDRDESLLAEALYVLARMQVNTGRSDAAEVSARRGLAMIDQIRDLSNNDRLTRIRLLEMQARRFVTRYESEQAIALRRRALNERIALFSTDHIDVASGHNNLASALHTGGRFKEAEYHYREVGRLLSFNDPGHPRMANVYLGLGVTQLGQGRLAAAENSLVRAMTSAMEHYGEASGLVTSSRMHLALLRRLQGRFRDAYALLEQVARTDEPDLVTFNQATASSWLGSLALTLERPAEAIDHFERAQAALDELEHQAHSHAMIGTLGASLARLLDRGEMPDPERTDRATSALFEVGAGPGQMHAEGAEILAALMHELGRSADADHWLTRAQALFTDHFGADHPRTRAVGHLYPPARSPGEGEEPDG